MLSGFTWQRIAIINSAWTYGLTILFIVTPAKNFNLKAAFTASQHKDILIRRQMALSSSHWDDEHLSVLHSQEQTLVWGGKVIWMAFAVKNNSRSKCLPPNPIFNIKRAHVSIRKTLFSRQSTEDSFGASLFNKTKLTKTSNGIFNILTTPELILFNLHCYLLINQRERDLPLP